MTFRSNRRATGRKVIFATRWQVQEGHLLILVHWGAYRQTVDKIGGQSVFSPQKKSPTHVSLVRLAPRH
jgi:hypothetical protein